MLSYQHMYHAGNLADIHKHVVLTELLTRLTQKEKPLTYMETHAGRGVYDLACGEALKTGESAEGIEAFLKKGKLPDAHPYVTLIKRMRSEIRPTLYPGSPFIAEALLRPTDDIVLMELHPREYAELRRLMHYPNTHLHHRDGYEGLIALTPPVHRRGLVLIDPSYEEKTEFDAVAKSVSALQKRWPQAVVMIWYPLLENAPHAEMVSRLTNGDVPCFKQEIFFKRTRLRMKGSGVVVLRPPYGVDDRLQKVADLF